MIARTGIRFLPVLIVLLLAPLRAAAESVAAALRVDDPLYRELRLAADLGLLSGTLHGTAPLSRAAAFRLLDTPLPAVDTRGATRSVVYRLERARRRVASPEAWAAHRYAVRRDAVGDQKIGVRYSEMVRGPRSPDYLDFGYDKRQGWVQEVDAGAYLEAQGAALDVSGRLRVDGDALTFRPLVATARMGWKGVRLVVGREPVRWGPDNFGNILLSENARPLDQARLEPDAPFRLPWELRHLGEFGFSILAGRLDDPDRNDVPNPYLTGARFTWAPVRWFLFGATRTSMLGEGNPFVLTPGSIWDLILASGENDVGGAGNDTDQKAMFEWNLYLWPLLRHVPVLDGGRFWYELGGEDSPPEGEIFPAATGSTYGIEFVARGTVLRAEFTALRDDKNLWYWHRVYTDGYTYRGRVMGHPAGGDSRAQSYGVDVPVGTWGLVTAGWERQELGFFANPGVIPVLSTPPILHGVQDVFRLGVETYVDRGPVTGTLTAEVRALRTFGDEERLGPLEQWGFTVAWRR